MQGSLLKSLIFLQTLDSSGLDRSAGPRTRWVGSIPDLNARVLKGLDPARRVLVGSTSGFASAYELDRSPNPRTSWIDPGVFGKKKEAAKSHLIIYTCLFIIMIGYDIPRDGNFIPRDQVIINILLFISLLILNPQPCYSPWLQ